MVSESFSGQIDSFDASYQRFREATTDELLSLVYNSGADRKDLELKELQSILAERLDRPVETFDLYQRIENARRYVAGLLAARED